VSAGSKNGGKRQAQMMQTQLAHPSYHSQ
jgi:hypothetical protein